VLVTAARRPVLTCARHLSIRHRGPTARNPQAPSRAPRLPRLLACVSPSGVCFEYICLY
jgi:hypothetical protein